MRKLMLVFLLLLTPLFLISSHGAFADSSVVQPADFFTQVLQAVAGFGSMAWYLKVSTVIMLVIASMKVSFLDQLIWDKLGKLQVWLAPALGLLAGVFALASSGTISLPGIFAYATAGAGAVFLHELLDLVKVIPGIGSTYVLMITWFESILGAAATPPAST